MDMQHKHFSGGRNKKLKGGDASGSNAIEQAQSKIAAFGLYIHTSKLQV